MGTFGMQTGEMHSGGVYIQKQAEDWGYARKKIGETIDFLLEAYPSSDGAALAEKVKGHDPELVAIENKLHAQGDYGVYASKTTVATNEEITSKIAKNI